MKLILKHEFENGRQYVNCYTVEGERLLSMLNEAGNSSDIKAMELAGLEPGDDDNVFLYANHLLGNKFTSYEFEIGTDLFEQHEALPKKVQTILENFGECASYKKCEKLLRKLKL